MASDALPMGYRPGPRRPGTPEEAHALAHPLRIRILRLALDTPRTNRELADLLGVNPGTALHHVRILVDHGFLVAGETRRGKRGSREVPYQATGKSWVLDFRDVEIGGEGHGPAMIAASHAEYLEAAPEDRLDALRIAMRLSPDERQAMVDRLYEVVEEFRDKESPDGEPMALFWALHLRRDA
jgi:DNA-binding transcriptional ArsR family regulator